MAIFACTLSYKDVGCWPIIVYYLDVEIGKKKICKCGTVLVGSHASMVLWSMSNLTYHGAKNMCRIVQDVRTLVSQTLRETTGRVIFGPNEI